ncbi:MAG: putative sugar nucleotidyl transferase, partial [Thermoproteota archaeon]
MHKFQLAIFEDYAYENFLPMTYTRPAFDLRCGALTFRSRISNFFSRSELLLFTREHLAEYIESKEKSYANRAESCTLSGHLRLLIDLYRSPV